MSAPNGFARRVRDVVRDALFVGGAFVVVLIVFALIRSDLDAKRTQTQPFVPLLKAGRESPTVLLFLHRIPPDQNVVEASVMLIVSDLRSINDIRAGKLHLAVEIRDGLEFKPYLRNGVTLPPEAPESNKYSFFADKNVMAAESTRFFIPFQATAWSYPLDKIWVKPIITINRQETGSHPVFSLHVQKALPGRVLTIDNERGNPTITLSRPWIQAALVFFASVVFLFLARSIAFELRVDAPRGLTEILAIAGFLVATAGFRDILGFSRLPTTCWLEIFVIILPMGAVSIRLLISLSRRQGQPTAKAASDGY